MPIDSTPPASDFDSGARPRENAMLVLQRGAPLDPVSVVEHQDVGAGNSAAAWTERHFRSQQAAFLVDLGNEVVRRPDGVVATTETLQVMDRPVAFADLCFGKAGFLELAVDVTGEHESAVFQVLADPTQNLESLVRNGVPVEVQSVPVETPGQAWTGDKGRGIGDLLESDARPTKSRVGAPEALPATKIGQTGIHPDAGTSGDEQSVSLPDEVRAASVVGSQSQSPCPRWSQMLAIRAGNGGAHLIQQASLVGAQRSLEHQPV